MRKNAKKYIKLKCNKCGCEFDRELREHTRQIRKNNHYKCYCSRECYDNLQCDEYSPFKRIFCCSKKSAKVRQFDFSISLEYLKKIWESQNGICPYTKIKMILPRSNSRKNIIKKCSILASLDRIDSSKGYIEGNIEFVCLAINYAKNGFSKEETQNFIKMIKEH